MTSAIQAHKDVRIGKTYDIVMQDKSRVQGMFIHGHEEGEVYLLASIIEGVKVEPRTLGHYFMMTRKGSAYLHPDEANDETCNIVSLDEVGSKPKPAPRPTPAHVGG